LTVYKSWILQLIDAWSVFILSASSIASYALITSSFQTTGSAWLSAISKAAGEIGRRPRSPSKEAWTTQGGLRNPTYMTLETASKAWSTRTTQSRPLSNGLFHLRSRLSSKRACVLGRTSVPPWPTCVSWWG
jgi:hypothetical protein